jgi:hypothetical protein
LLFQNLPSEPVSIDSKNPYHIPSTALVDYRDVVACADAQTGAQVIQERACNGDDTMLNLVGGNEENRHVGTLDVRGEA